MTEVDMEVQRLRRKVAELSDENEQLRKQMEDYVIRFRACRMCANIHADCSPTDESCKPRWGNTLC